MASYPYTGGHYLLRMHAWADPEKRPGTLEWGYRQMTPSFEITLSYMDLRAEMEQRGLHELRNEARKHGQYLAHVEWEWLLMDDDFKVVKPQPLPPSAAVITSNVSDIS